MPTVKSAFNITAGSIAPAVTRLVPRKLVLCYHRFSHAGRPDPFHNPVTATPVKELEKQLLWLKSFCLFRTLDEIATPSSSGKSWEVAITIDDGYQDVIDLGLPLFEKHKIPVSWFVTTDPVINPDYLPWWDLSSLLANRNTGKLRVNIDERTKLIDLSNNADSRWLRKTLRELFLFGSPNKANKFKQQVIRELSKHTALPRNSFVRPDNLKKAAASDVMDIGPHTCTHPNLARLSHEEQTQEILSSINALKAMGIEPINWFSYPFGKDWARSETTLEIVRSLGLKGCATTGTGYVYPDTPSYLVPRISVDGRWDIRAFKARVVFGPLTDTLKSFLSR